MSAPPTPAAAVVEQRYPSDQTMRNAAKIAIDFYLKGQDKPILMDYWVPSIERRAMIGVKPTNEKLLILNKDEYTSNISKMYYSNNKTEIIMLSENSIYIVAAGIETRSVS
jgi:hypothetical protein